MLKSKTVELAPYPCAIPHWNYIRLRPMLLTQQKLKLPVGVRGVSHHTTPQQILACTKKRDIRYRSAINLRFRRLLLVLHDRVIFNSNINSLKKVLENTLHDTLCHSYTKPLEPQFTFATLVPSMLRQPFNPPFGRSPGRRHKAHTLLSF
jgi:hypothetical protein